MATEYRLPYTASEIDRKLGAVDTLSAEIGNLEEGLMQTSEGLVQTNETVGENSQKVNNALEAITQLSSEKANKLEVANYITPQMYGAKGDGVTDDTQAFQRALEENNELFLPKGNYLIKETINLTNEKKLFSNNREATIKFNGIGSVFYLGRRTILRGIKVRIENAGVTKVFDTDNRIFPSTNATLMTEVNDIEVYFAVQIPNATVFNIVASNQDYKGSVGFHNQNYSNIHLAGYTKVKYGIKICVSFDAPFSANETPWVTDLRFNHIWLGSPYCAIKIHRENNSGTEIPYDSIVRTEHMMFTDIASQYMTTEETRKFYEVEYCMAEFINCQPWDYHRITESGLKYNTIGQGALLSEVNARRSPILCAEFPSVTATTPEEDPAYFLNTFFNFQSNIDGDYDYIDMKCQEAVSSVEVDEIVVEGIAQRVVDEAMSGVYFNVMADERTEVRVNQRFSNSGQVWQSADGANDALIIPIQDGTNLIRWEGNELADAYMTVFFHNDLTSGVKIDESPKLLVTNGDDMYLKIDNPSGYQYLSIPFKHTAVTMNTDNMIVTINQLIKESSLSYVSEHMNNANIHVTSEDKEKWSDKYTKVESDNKYQVKGNYLTNYTETDPTVPSWAKASSKPSYTKSEVGLGNVDNVKQYSASNPPPYPVTSVNGKTGVITVSVPTKTSQLTNDNGFITAADIPEAQVPDLSGYALKSNAETWTFTLADGSTVTKRVVLA